MYKFPKIVQLKQDCSVDIRKEMVRSIYLSGGVTLLPNFPERLEAEIDRITPSHLIPKVSLLFLFHFASIFIYINHINLILQKIKKKIGSRFTVSLPRSLPGRLCLE